MSSEPDVCKTFLGTTPDSKQIFSWIMSTSARSIINFSAYPDEQEYLLLPGTQVKIINKTIDSLDNLNIVVLKEMPVYRKSEYIFHEHYQLIFNQHNQS